MVKVAKPVTSAPNAPRTGSTRPAPVVRKPAAGAAPNRLARFGNLGSRSLGQTPTISFFREAFAELSKVHWPTREETLHMTVIVIVFSLATGLVLGGLDYGFAQIVALLVGAQ
jgi:preprotein translocase subunit SecE